MQPLHNFLLDIGYQTWSAWADSLAWDIIPLGYDASSTRQPNIDLRRVQTAECRIQYAPNSPRCVQAEMQQEFRTHLYSHIHIGADCNKQFRLVKVYKYVSEL